MFFLLALLLAPPETAILGGACAPEPNPDPMFFQKWLSLVTRFNDMVKSSDHDGAAEIAREVVRGACRNDWWWYKLAGEYYVAGSPKKAVEVLQVMQDRKSNSVAMTLASPDSPIRGLRETDAFKQSKLAMALEAETKELEARRAKARGWMATHPAPPSRYVANPACPFECCRFGDWTSRQEVLLYEAPEGARVVGKIRKGEKITALTGRVILRPAPVLVRAKPQDANLTPGSVVYLLDYTGEGYSKVWAGGKVLHFDVSTTQERCPFPGHSCWGEFVDPEDAGQRREHVWWVRIRTSRGSIGWTKVVDHFDGTDGCG